MSAHPDIRVAPVNAALRPALLQLAVHEAQQPFVSPIAVTLADAELCSGSEGMAIVCDGAPIGFYRIETQPGCIADRDFPRPTLGLRSFFIDARWQGRGLGTLALVALVDDLARRHPDAQDLVLTVNTRNTAGIALYRRAGFVDSGELYHGGRSGPQHLMVLALAP
jgi:RimJ/RimL family protein N-acetyltransferase